MSEGLRLMRARRRAGTLPRLVVIAGFARVLRRARALAVAAPCD